MAAAETVDEYIAGFPPEVAERLQRIRETILAEVPLPEEKVRYGIAAVMLGGRYALHYAGWKKHIGLYPVPTLDRAARGRGRCRTEQRRTRSSSRTARRSRTS